MVEESSTTSACVIEPDCIKFGSQTVELLHRGERSLPIPYAFTIGAINFAGIFYLRDPLENSYTDGAFIGVVTGSYHIDKDDTEACADNGLLKACIKVDYGRRRLFGRVCTRKFTGGWDCSGWKEIMRW